MADYVMEMPSQLGKWRKFLYQNQATTGRVLPESQFMASLQGAYDSAYDNYYRNKALSLQQENSDRNYDLQRQQLEMQKDYYDDQNSLSTKLGGGAMELGKAYLYGKGIHGGDITPKWMQDAGSALYDRYAPQGVKDIFGESTVAVDNIGRQMGTGTPTGQVFTERAITATPEPAGLVDTVADYGRRGLESVGFNMAPEVSANYAALPSVVGTGLASMGVNNVMTGLSPYASGLASIQGATSGIGGTVSPAMQALDTSAMNSIGSSLGGDLTIAPNAALGEFASSIGSQQAGNVGAGLAAEGSTAAITGGEGAVTGGLTGAVSGLTGGILAAGVGVGLNYLFDEIGMPSKMAGPLAGMGSGAIAGAAMTAWSGPGAILGAAIGGVIGAIGTMFDSWLCGMVDKHVGMTEHEKLAMNQLKDWCKENQHRWLRWYIANGCELVECIEADEDNMLDYCSQLRITMIEPVVALVDRGDLEGAYKVYKTMAGFQFAKYAPHILIPESFMMERKEAYAESATA